MSDGVTVASNISFPLFFSSFSEFFFLPLLPMFLLLFVYLFYRLFLYLFFYENALTLTGQILLYFRSTLTLCRYGFSFICSTVSLSLIVNIS